MLKKEIIQRLSQNHTAFVQKLESLSDEDFLRIPGSKWSAGQQLDHILKSVVPVAKALNAPLAVLESKYGLAERPSQTYEELVALYLETLKNLSGFKLPKRFTPIKITAEEKDIILKELLDSVKLLNHGILQSQEGNLDSYAIVHPAMGKLSLREMLYFTTYHVTHHDKQILKNLNKYKS